MPYPALRLQLLRFSPDAPTKSAEHAIPFDLAFEDAVQRLNKQENLFVELDGSFVWTSGQSNDRWQMDGMIYDRNVPHPEDTSMLVSRIQWCELTGQFSLEIWRRFLTCVCDSQDGLHVYDLSTGVMSPLEEASRLWSSTS